MALGSISIIVPAHNNAAVIARALRSVETSVEHFRQMAKARHVAVEVVVVDDSSTDGTRAAIDEFVAGKPLFRAISAFGRSASSSRNTGVKHARGDVLMFLDGDDCYLPTHVYSCYSELVRLECGYIRTLVRPTEAVHPDWHDAIANSSVFNLCVRRDCHDFLGGMPDFHVMRRDEDAFLPMLDLVGRNEDIYYNHLLVAFFHGYRLTLETVEYYRYPGNAFDRQYEKFQQPWGAVPEHHSPDELIRKQLMQSTLDWWKQKLLAKRRTLGSGGGGMPFKV